MNLELSTGVRLHVRDRGPGTVAGAPSYLFIHGWAVSGAIWDPILERWPDTAGRVLAPDQRGTGFSDKPPAGGYTLDAYVGDMVALIDQLELSDVVLVGHSMGGTIAQKVALERPSALRGLVLVSPVPASGVPLDDGQIAYFRSLGGTREGAEQVLRMVMAKPPDEPLFERMVRDVATVCLAAFLDGFDAWRTASFAERLSELTVPTLVLGGSDEQPLTPDFSKAAVADKIAGARFELLQGSGHYPQYEVPDALLAHLLAAATLGR
jgi:pimeloyl-ACP methyl ester carboxylesterase